MVARYGGFLRSVDEFVDDISRQRIGTYPTFKLRVSKNFFYGSKRRSQLALPNYPDERRLQVGIAAVRSETEIGSSIRITNTTLSIARIIWCR